jgi:hypothetical protein
MLNIISYQIMLNLINNQNIDADTNNWIDNMLNNRNIIILLCGSFILLYLILSQILESLYYLSEFLIFAIMPIKTVLIVFSDDTCHDTPSLIIPEEKSSEEKSSEEKSS